MKKTTGNLNQWSVDLKEFDFKEYMKKIDPELMKSMMKIMNRV